MAFSRSQPRLQAAARQTKFFFLSAELKVLTKVSRLSEDKIAELLTKTARNEYKNTPKQISMSLHILKLCRTRNIAFGVCLCWFVAYSTLGTRKITVHITQAYGPYGSYEP